MSDHTRVAGGLPLQEEVCSVRVPKTLTTSKVRSMSYNELSVVFRVFRDISTILRALVQYEPQLFTTISSESSVHQRIRGAFP